MEFSHWKFWKSQEIIILLNVGLMKWIMLLYSSMDNGFVVPDAVSTWIDIACLIEKVVIYFSFRV